MTCSYLHLDSHGQRHVAAVDWFGGRYIFRSCEVRSRFTAWQILLMAAVMVGSATLHNRTVWSPLAVARVRPSGLNATDFTASVWPVRVLRGCPLGTSHNRTVRSLLAVARVRPSGLNATDHTGSVWPVKV